MACIVYEGVAFNVEPCARMGKAGFIAAHAGQLWGDRDEATRKEMLSEAYGLIAGRGQSPSPALHEGNLD